MRKQWFSAYSKSQVLEGGLLYSAQTVVRIVKVRPDYWTLEWPLPTAKAREFRRVRMPVQRVLHYIRENGLDVMIPKPGALRPVSSDPANPRAQKPRSVRRPKRVRAGALDSASITRL